MKKKRILFFLPFMNGGGAERVILTLLTHLNRDQYEPVLVLLKKEGRYLSLIPADIEVVDLDVGQARFAIFKIIKIIKEKNPDIVFTTLAYLNLIIAMTRVFLPKNITFIARESNTVSVRNQREKYPKIFNWLYRHIYKNFDLIVTQAQYMKNDLIEHFGIDKTKMQIIYNPVDCDFIDKQTGIDKVCFNDEKYNLLAVGKLGYQKGFDILLSIMTKLDDSYHLTILGEGSDKDKLNGMIKDLGLKQRVTLAGFCDNPYLYMKQADLFLLSSRYEGLPNVVLEANACGTPVVAFDAPGGTGEIICHAQNGFLVVPFDEEAFAASICDARQYDFDKEAIKHKTRENFSSEKILQQYTDIFAQKGR